MQGIASTAQGPDEGGNKKISRKEGQRSIPNRKGRDWGPTPGALQTVGVMPP